MGSTSNMWKRMPPASNYTLSLVLFLTSAFILRAGVEPTILPYADHRHGVVFIPASGPEAIPLPLHKVTAYCACPLCCGKWSDGFTASGSVALQGRTLAADTSIWSFGTCLALPGVGRRTVEDTGRLIVGRALDVFFTDHEEARGFGVKTLLVEEC